MVKIFSILMIIQIIQSLEGVRAIKIMNNLLPKELKKNLPIFNKLNNFFSNKKQKFEIDFKQLFKC